MWCRRLAPSVLALLAILAPRTAATQVVVGRVVEAETDRAVRGAFVALVDTLGVGRASGLAGTDGQFRLRAPTPGVYRVRTDRIGYESVFSGLLHLGPDSLVTVRIEAPGRAVAIEGIQVEGEGRCALRPEEGEPTHVLWEEARKALRITEWTSSREHLLYEVVVFERELDRETMVVVQEQVQTLGIRSDQPFYPVNPDSLARAGYVQRRGRDTYYYGLDAAVILSDAFLDRHCFRRVEGGTALAGLAFEPIDPDAESEIRGTLWVDRTTLELRILEFGYVNPPFARIADPESYGGRVEFRQLPDGAWVVSRWRIRSPTLTGRRRLTHHGFSEAEGEILNLYDAAGEPLPWRRDGALLTGTVVHPRTGAALPRATVRLVGTPYQVETDEYGRFGISGLPGHRYRVEATHPDLPDGRVEQVVELSRGGVAKARIGAR